MRQRKPQKTGYFTTQVLYNHNPSSGYKDYKCE